MIDPLTKTPEVSISKVWRRSTFCLIVLMIVATAGAVAQSITWTEVTGNYTLPEGIKVFNGKRSSPLLESWYIDVDLNNPKIAVRPYLSTASGGKEPLPGFTSRVGAIGAVNGGYFDVSGSTSFSAVVYPGEVVAQNIKTVSRTSGTYTVTRSFFGMNMKKKASVDWIYHFGSTVSDIYRFAQPTANTQTTPAPPPVMTNGTRYDSLLVGIGGGPTLINNGQINITYDQEVFFGSGVDGGSQNPRTAVGYTADNHAILLVADGRQTASAGVTLDDLAQIMSGLNCIGAMNLDGGGSTQMAIGSQYVNSPSENRAVPTILAVVYPDSIKFPPTIYFEKVIDTGDPSCKLVGTGWFPSANSGYWGTTPAQLNTIGSGDRYALFSLNLPKSGIYEVYGWWVAASNRSTTTPFIVKHKNGIDTVRVDQTVSGSKWNRIGSFTFSSDSSDVVSISNAATTGTYIVADAIRIVSYDSTITSAETRFSDGSPGFGLEQNYPNPFNPVTVISFQLSAVSFVTLKVYDILGREVAVLVDGEKEAGRHIIEWNAGEFPSGVYFYRLNAWSSSRHSVETRRMVLAK